MSDEQYVPTMDEVRNNFAFSAALATFASATEHTELMAAFRDRDWPVVGAREAEKSVFDAWLAAHERQVKAEALREAVDGGLWALRGPAEWLRDRAARIESQETP